MPSIHWPILEHKEHPSAENKRWLIDPWRKKCKNPVPAITHQGKPKLGQCSPSIESLQLTRIKTLEVILSKSVMVVLSTNTNLIRLINREQDQAHTYAERVLSFSRIKRADLLVKRRRWHKKRGSSQIKPGLLITIPKSLRPRRLCMFPMQWVQNLQEILTTTWRTN